MLRLPLFLVFLLPSQLASAQLAPMPQALDFGAIARACPLPQGFVGLENLGSEVIEISGALVEGSELVQLSPEVQLPLQLAPGARATLAVHMVATPTGPWQAVLRIETSVGPRAVDLYGEVLDRIEDRHVTAAVEAVDILIVIDDAASMRQEQASLAANFRALAQFLRALEGDGRVGVTTTAYAQDGRLLALPGTDRTVLNVLEPDFEASFANLTGSVGAVGPEDHAGLWAVQRALSPDNLAAANAGFLRPDTGLSVILVSDRPDLSPGAVDEYVTGLQGVNGFHRTRLLTFSSIVGDSQGGCSGAGGDAQAGHRYIAVARQTGGVFQSICAGDWSRALEYPATVAFGVRSVFWLSHVPVISSIKVFDDLASVPATSAAGTVNWTYDDGPTRVGFTPFSVPSPGSQIEIDYPPRCKIARAVYD